MADPETIGRYRILERVGRGGMGVLYRGVDPVLDREVAIKVMSAEVTGDDDAARTRFFREARAAAKLQHRNIVTIFEFAEQDGVPYIVMEFLRGRSLSSRMTAQPPMTIDQALDIVGQLCVGLQFAHENGVVHRDVKPANVWLLEDGSVKLLDFGIAKLGSSAFTKAGDVLGSAAYMAPEQLSGGTVDGRVDIFASAVVLYELLAGRKPFEGDSPTSTILKIVQEEPAALEAVVPGLPPALSAAVKRGLEKDPAKRYQSAAEFGAELQTVRFSLPISGETMFADDFRFDEVVSKSQVRRIEEMPIASPANTTAAEPDVNFRDADDTAEVDFGALAVARSAGSSRWKMLIGIAAAAVLLLGAAAWFALPHAVRPPGAPLVEPPAAAEQKAVVPATEEKPTVIEDPTPATPAELEDAPRMQAAAPAPAAPPAKPVKLQATGSYPFEIVDGKRVVSASAASHDISVAPPRVLRLRAPGYFLDQSVKVDGSARSMQVAVPELGQLTIRSTMETCQVSVNGRDVGFPPVNALPIAAGTYNVQLKCPDGRIVRGSPVTVSAGQTLIAKVP